MADQPEWESDFELPFDEESMTRFSAIASSLDRVMLLSVMGSAVLAIAIENGEPPDKVLSRMIESVQSVLPLPPDPPSWNGFTPWGNNTSK